MLTYDDYLAAVERESRRFIEAAGAGAPDRDVPSCPDWRLSDLVWHLTGVQHFWASIVEGRLLSPEVEELDRPGDGELGDLFAATSQRLVGALRYADPGAACWTWHPEGTTVGWVARRQAHEALIHRLDAELTADDVTPVDDTLGLDGVDEILRIMIAGIPDWGTFTPEGVTLAIVAESSGTRWDLEFGRFTGTSPRTGTDYDLDAAELRDPLPDPAATITGVAGHLDAWLWGRAPLSPATVTGDPSLAHRFRTLAAESTQ